MLKPWAGAVSRYMIAEVNKRNEATWKAVGKEMGRALLAEIQQAPTGMLFSALQDEQVSLITSLPLGAAKRVHDLTQKGLIDSRRAGEIAKEIARTGQVTESRARLIARTEVARTANNLTQARAMFIGAEGYIWRTSEDGDVRPTHKKQNGRFIRYDNPPKTDASIDPYHAGCGPNCRCFQDPVLPDFNDMD
jgi:SPP1 gp7 family putative phage head morphogenesis protein